MQKLNINMSITIPDDMVMITKVELEELKQESLKGIYWTMKDLESRTGMKRVWLQENILYKPQFKKQLDAEFGGFVKYPKSQGEKWAFLASRMSQFLEDNFCSIFS